jgi:hypothetical protein
MSYKTERLTRLFPDAYAAGDREALLYKLLDAIGAELMDADESIKGLLKSHWVDYATGPALDGLAACLSVSRRQLRGGDLEGDDAFRQRLKSVVPLFTGGGTRAAVLGAVRSALGLPFDLNQLNLPAGFEGLRTDIENLITLVEFSPKGSRIVGRDIAAVTGASEMKLVVDIASVQGTRPTIQWKFTLGGARRLSLTVQSAAPGSTPHGIRAAETLTFSPGQTLVLTQLENGRLSAVVGFQELAGQFTNLDGSQPAILPEVPTARSEWTFRAEGGLFDISGFDEPNTFDLPVFEVELSWLRHEPLTFDVNVPYFLQRSVADLVALHKYPGNVFVFEGLPLEAIVDVVDQTRAAGVRGSVQFSLTFLDEHDQRDDLHVAGDHRLTETQVATEALIVTSLNDVQERHDLSEGFMIGGVFDVSTFDQDHVFDR